MTSPGPDDVRVATDSLVAMLIPAVKGGADFEVRAGQLRWSCRHTLAHVVDCLFWYAANLVRRSTRQAASPDVADTEPLPQLVDSIRSGAALLALAVEAADDDARAWHSYGIADRSGFAAMGCDEALVHGHDLAAGLGVAYEPPLDVAERTLRRLFPWAPVDVDPWPALLWANGRQPLGDQPPERNWRWHCAPLAEWT